MKFHKCPECETEVPQWYQGTDPVTGEPMPSAELGDEDPGRRCTGMPCPDCGALLPPIPPVEEPRWRVPPGGPALWGQVLRGWTTPKRHRDFVHFCADAGCLDYAARRYRRWQDRHGGGDAQADWALQEIQRLALTALTPTQRPEHRRFSTTTLVVAALFAALLALLFASLFQRLGSLALP